MKKMLSGSGAIRRGSPRRVVAASALFALLCGGTALSQDIGVTGTVTAPTGAPLREVLIRVQGTDTRALTDASGRYAVRAPADGVLSFTLLGRRAVQEQIAGRTTINVTMEQVPYLEEVVVTSYTEQRRADITGAVSGVDLEAASRQSGASVLQRLDATAPGVTVASSGSPGSRSTVRVRGISSFQNNDPLYIVDGTPVQDTYMNFLNPNDITSIQVLKDASAASIYGARANNGVIVIETTKKGAAGPPQVTLRARAGVAGPVRGYDDFLITNALDYHAVLKQSYINAGEPVPTNIYGDPNNPTVPAFIWPNSCAAVPQPAACRNVVTAFDAWGRPTSVNTNAYSFPNTLIMPGSAGTNWWDAVFGTAPVEDYNLDVSGGSDVNAYRVSFNYFHQGGTARWNDFKRGSVRVNTQFNRGRFNFGENLAIAVNRHHGGMPSDPDGYAEDGILGKNILMQPVVPVYDLNGNFAGGKATGLGNQQNPLKAAWAAKDDENNTDQMFGNLFAGLEINPSFTLRTSLGFNLSQNSTLTFTPSFPEVAEATFSNAVAENTNRFTDWTWSNTLRYSTVVFSQHTVNVLLGQEANASNNRYIEGSIGSLINPSVDSRYIQDALGAGKNVLSTGGRAALLSFFGKVDYNFADRYVASVTVRRDGSSRLAPGHRWGTFPAFGLGWRISNEPFLANNRIFSDVMLRYGWGVTGNQFIPSGRIVARYGGSRGDAYYDVAGSNNSIVGGYRQVSQGNPDLKWEENRSTNIGADMVLLDGLLNVVIDVYRRQTNNLLFDPRQPATAGDADPPIINVGKMRNTGFDLSIGHEGSFWNATLNVGHYKNKIVSIDGATESFRGPISTRFGNQIINQVGHPIGSFYGYIAEGFFRDAADVAAHASQAGAKPGRIKFRDVNGDGSVTLADRTIIGDPHPDFTAGLDLGVRRGNWDLSTTFFGTFGNDIFENQKEFYVFREFDTNVRKDLLANSWTPQNPNAKYPRLDKNDTFSWALSSYYVEDGSYIRLRSLQLGYNVPSSLGRWLKAGSRLYLQAENLFTITDYEGLDPALPAAAATGAAGDVRDQYRGVDRGSYPSNRVFSLGVVTSF